SGYLTYSKVTESSWSRNSARAVKSAVDYNRWLKSVSVKHPEARAHHSNYLENSYSRYGTTKKNYASDRLRGKSKSSAYAKKSSKKKSVAKKTKPNRKKATVSKKAKN